MHTNVFVRFPRGVCFTAAAVFSQDAASQHVVHARKRLGQIRVRVNVHTIFAMLCHFAKENDRIANFI